MFRSKQRPLIIPQLEHARLSGYLAYFWGNDEVNPPPIDAEAFTAGVTHHDRGYGRMDTMGIGEVELSVWYATQRRGILTPLADPTADTVALLHIRRLLAMKDDDTAHDLIALADHYIEANIPKTPYTRQDFDSADRITNLCDMIAFNFCFEARGQFSMPVPAGGGLVDIQVTLAEGGVVTLNPWPLAVPELRGFILGYEPVGYPDHPQPVTVDFVLRSE